MAKSATQLRVIQDMLNSMLRSDYIALRDSEKLKKLSSYYVDYMGCLRQILADSDQLVVGRRGTGKTTLLYRALIECMNSWSDDKSLASRRTLGIYLDVSRCQSLAEGGEQEFVSFEMSFVSELCNAIIEEINRNWPAARKRNILGHLFKSAEEKKRGEVTKLISSLSDILLKGIPTLTERSIEAKVKTVTKKKDNSGRKANILVKADVSAAELPSLSAGLDATSEQSEELQNEKEWVEKTHYRLNISDILNIIGDIREQSDISSIYIFIDEFSGLSLHLQGRFTTIIKKIIGNQRGLYIKLCAITDNFTLGSSIILQRDLFEIPLDLDSFVERSDSINAAIGALASFTKHLIVQRLESYTTISPPELFEDPETAYRELSRAAMGVPRTLGLALTAAWNRAQSVDRDRISRADIEYGIKSASRGYLNQLTGASKGGVAVPEYVRDIWDALIERAMLEKTRGRGSASHFNVLPKHQEKLRILNMFFVIHLLKDGRTTKKDSSSRSLYCIDYGQCLENNLEYDTDKNVIRQQRFVYDDIFSQFDKYFSKDERKKFVCPKCGTEYSEDQLFVAGIAISYCPRDRTDLVVYESVNEREKYTEEEIKIIGAIRSSDEDSAKAARKIADDVGCYSQKVGKFGEKLERCGLILRKKATNNKHYYYYSNEK